MNWKFAIIFPNKGVCSVLPAYINTIMTRVYLDHPPLDIHFFPTTYNVAAGMAKPKDAFSSLFPVFYVTFPPCFFSLFHIPPKSSIVIFSPLAISPPTIVFCIIHIPE